MKVGDLVQHKDPFIIRVLGLKSIIGIVTNFVHDGEEAIVVFTSGKRFIDKKDSFKVISSI